MSDRTSHEADASWELRHWRWVHEEGNPCEECDRERGFDRPLSQDRWASLVVACAGWWDGTLLPVLHRWARDGRRRLGVRLTATSPAPGPDHDPDVDLLRRIAEDRDWDLAAVTARGAIQSVPAHAEEVAAAEQRSREAWSAYADALFGPLPLITPTAAAAGTTP